MKSEEEIKKRIADLEKIKERRLHWMAKGDVLTMTLGVIGVSTLNLYESHEIAALTWVLDE